jgi:hypothetical protein
VKCYIDNSKRLRSCIRNVNTGVDGIFGSMSLIENLLSQFVVLWNHQAVFEP